MFATSRYLFVKQHCR